MQAPIKLALSQLNYKIGDFDANKAKIINEIKKAAENQVDLIIFSELAICGYPPLDMLTREEFVREAIDCMHEIAKHCQTVTAIVGGPSINPGSKGKQLFNSAWLLSDGDARPVVHKTLLPTYDVFDEYRYFQPNQDFNVISFKGHRIAITICEDIWDDRPIENAFDRNHLYTLSPMQKLAALRPTFAINIAASPFSYHQHEIRKQVVCKKAAQYQIPVFYVNQTGANTELIFDGGSMVISPAGDVMHRLSFFKEETFYTNFNEPATPNKSEEKPSEIELIYQALVTGVRDYFNKSGLKKALVGLSGGIDSALTAAIAVAALGKENVHGILMPSQYSSDHSVTDARDLAENLGMSYEIIPIKEIVNQFDSALENTFSGKESDLAEENIQARIRGTLLMAYSNKFGNILLNTSNKSEAAVGYGTLYGDMNGGLSVLGDVYKTRVFEMCRFLNRYGEIIPENTITKPPSAELRPDQKDSDSLPEYNLLDAILFRYIEQNRSAKEIVSEGFDQDTVLKTIQMVNRNEHKRFQAPPVLRVSGKAFGFGRRIPLVARY
ncbi:NAD+ synthase [Natronoflexus pectinivorans]|uniref:Glutamine-dependent NAD(+) synthetase n=1 Tax=Natronoflexus pectinivorans TaxID=682526 RepID=A0A4V2RWB6_9BACT|nr:NAD+ synthase [Natronoflexus pectinivorans]TCO07675.1 NAD+ synthase (glutamine-hydrolysing) [Natronoflexus pectinivorans]